MGQHEADWILRDALRLFMKMVVWEERFRRAAFPVVWSLGAIAAGIGL